MTIDSWDKIRQDRISQTGLGPTVPLIGGPKTAAEVEPANPDSLLATGKEIAAFNAMAAVIPNADDDMPVLYQDPVEEAADIQPVNGAKALDLVYLIVDRWSRLQEWEKVVTTLWIAHTWFTNGAEPPKGRLLFRSTPRWLAIAEPGSGKTTVMELMQGMSHKPTGIVNAPVSAPGVREALSQGMSVFLDEVHRQFGRGRGHLDLQSIVTGGYTSKGGSLNAYGGVNEQSIFGPIALGSRPEIETGTGDVLTDVFQRAFVIRPEKSYDDIPALDEAFDELVRIATKWLQRWAAQERPTPSKEDPDPKLAPFYQINPKLKGRPRQIASPLLAVADRADRDLDGNRDLRWPLRARRAIDTMLVGGDSLTAGESRMVEARKLNDETENMLAKLGLSLG